ncbi:FecCD family ABC transporter permease [Velocimicrobium porci]|uniref:Iron ABC transporter permease n=1 Tax=Velocimicrobium porci TaxID=2606634 RepID=A0A6L5Y1L9_9FIRM|nr:iron ABC transporter permease [Velocimicrobium porci]MSS64727.1 iron ABC transporter permease [Velocimicrobium porci]
MKHKNKVFTFICIIFLLITVLLALMIGSYQMTPNEVLQTFLGNGSKLQNFTIFQIRLPRTVLAIIVATALGISGSVLQGITRNPLAEPGMIGINAGAALGVVLWISSGTSAYYSALPISTVIFLPLIAMVGSLVSVTFIYFFAYKKGISPVRFILTGVGVNAGISAIISFYQLNMSKGDYNQVLTWTNGSLWGSNWNYILLTAPIIFGLAILILIRSRVLDVLSLGDELATGLGVQVQKEILFFLITASFLAAIATSVAGNIAFIGLLGPKLAEKVLGGNYRTRLPFAAGISAIILVLADTVSRNLFAPIEIPVGIIVSILGVPYFIYLMIKEK